MYNRLIGVVKILIKKVPRRALISLPELQTLIKEVQPVVNDRPITFVYHDVNDPEPLTPSKLLYGSILLLCRTLLLILTSWKMKTSMNMINSIRP